MQWFTKKNSFQIPAITAANTYLEEGLEINIAILIYVKVVK
jgi:hypothetical protein